MTQTSIQQAAVNMGRPEAGLIITGRSSDPAGNMTLEGRGGDDRVYGGPGHDQLFGRGGDDFIAGADGDDILAGGDGDDSLMGEDGNDHLFGGSGGDILAGNAGNDVIFGGVGADFIEGGVGDDALFGDAGNDWIYGGAGEDLILGGTGDDVLFGGAGDDTILIRRGDGRDTILRSSDEANACDRDIVRLVDLNPDELDSVLMYTDDVGVRNLVLRYGDTNQLLIEQQDRGSLSSIHAFWFADDSQLSTTALLRKYSGEGGTLGPGTPDTGATVMQALFSFHLETGQVLVDDELLAEIETAAATMSGLASGRTQTLESA